MVRERERERGRVKRREGGRVRGGRVEYSAQRSDEEWRKKGGRRYTHIYLQSNTIITNNLLQIS